MDCSYRFKKALEYAAAKHKGQYRKGGEAYITHPEAVARILRDKGFDEDYQIAGLFHDLLEDTDASEEEIEALGGPEVLEAVKLLTKQKGYVMADYIHGIKANPMAAAVKAADRLHNLQSAVIADEAFKRKYILESINWYLDFSPEIPVAVKKLADTLNSPPRKLLEAIAGKPGFSYVKNEHETEDLRTSAFILKGDICYSISLNEMITMEGAYAVCVDGKSRGVYKTVPEEYRSLPIYDYGRRIIIPGMVDLHIHAPQYAFRGTGMDMELMEWLQSRTFPEEARYEDEQYARKAYTIFAEQMKKSATSHACIFATKHRKATELLMELMEDSGIVSFVGKVNMDREAPESLCEPSADYSAFDTFGWINSVNGKYKNTKPILTPRFIPCCTPELLEQLREIQNAYDLPVQSHLSENPGEIEWVRQHCPDALFYGDAYDGYGLFGEDHRRGRSIRTVMAHCVYSSEDEIKRLHDNGVFVAHCPASNVNLSSGIAPVRKYIDEGLKIGIGSDVAGGHTESMLQAVCHAVQASKMYWRLEDRNMKPLSFDEAFYLGTKGGGEFFGKVGSFEEGYDFSAVILDDLYIPYPGELTLHDRLERAAYLSLDMVGLCAKYVAGRKLFDYTPEVDIGQRT